MFDRDLNDDDTTGLMKIDNIGAVHLSSGYNNYNQQQYYIQDGSKEPIGLQAEAVPIGPSSREGWNAIQVTGENYGYAVLWLNSNGHEVWKVDASGNFIGISTAKLWEDEIKYGIDLNGDGTAGLIMGDTQTCLAVKNEFNNCQKLSCGTCSSIKIRWNRMGCNGFCSV